ncbi:MAG TPA: DUF998 domain-containing protein [Beutenbergiaceae bacterium]|nr:DUF998 domain-containing protein [Beutenbergiaceae bacterium]
MNTALLIAAAAAAGFVVVFTLDGWTRPEYRPVYHPVSALALGGRGWVQTANFIAAGAGVTFGGLTLVGTTWPFGVALAVLGLGTVASGAFRMDPMRGYPPGTPEGDPEQFTWRHRWHDHAGFVVFATLPVAAVIAVFAPALSGPLRLVSAVVAVTNAMLAMKFGQAWEADHPRTGLWQKLALGIGWGWLAAVFFALA